MVLSGSFESNWKPVRLIKLVSWYEYCVLPATLLQLIVAYVFCFSSHIKKSRDEYVKRLNGIYVNNLDKVCPLYLRVIVGNLSTS